MCSLLALSSCGIHIRHHYQPINYNDMINKNTEYFDFKKVENSIDKDGYAYKEYTLSNGDIESYGTTPYDNGYSYTPKFGWFIVGKEYYKNGVIKNKFVGGRGPQKYGKEYFYDEMGKLTKEIDHDKGYHLRLEQVVDLAIELCKKYGFDANIGMESPRQKTDVMYVDETWIRREDTPKGKRWYIGSSKDLVEHVKDIGKAKQLLSVIIDDATGKILFEKFYIDGYIWDTNSHPLHIEEMYEKENKKTSAVYKTYQGKDYTQAEWKIFEQEYYNEHLRKTGKAHLIQSAETPKTEIKKSSFLADEDDIKPKKKKGFGDNLESATDSKSSNRKRPFIKNALLYLEMAMGYCTWLYIT